MNLWHNYTDFNFEGEWNFFATSHGKSAAVGIGGTVKQLMARASLHRPFNNQIFSAEAVYQLCS